MPPRRKAPAAKAKACSKAAPPPSADNDAAAAPLQQQQGEPSAVAALFNRAQEAGTAAAAKRLADLLWSAWARQAQAQGGDGDDDDDAFWLELERCVSHLLVNAPQVKGWRRAGALREKGGCEEKFDCSSASAASNWSKRKKLSQARVALSLSLLAYDLSSPVHLLGQELDSRE